MSDEKLTRIENKLDKVAEDMSEVKSTLSAQHESLKYHIKRTDLLEKEQKVIQKNYYKILGGIAALAIILEILFRTIGK